MRIFLACAIGYIFGLTLFAQPAPQSHHCSTAMSEMKRSEIVLYVIKKYRLSPSVNVKLTSVKQLGDTCYQELVFEGESQINTWHLALYLSPDQRFLTDELFDTSIDPREEERRKAETLMADIAQSKGAGKGPETALVTIVVFSDFQCPYCQRFADILRQVLLEENDRIRIVFHHLPLSMHTWARPAAEGAACAQLQSSDAFWSMHDYLFAHQSEITAENIKQKIALFAKDLKGLDFSTFQDCEKNQMSLGLILRDMNLASINNVSATPTLFINGVRIQGVKDAAQLKQLISEAEVQTTAGSIRSASTGKR